jgi:predicted acetyltransferase
MTEPPLELRPITPTEFTAYHAMTSQSFLEDTRAEDRELELATFEYDRSIAAFAGDQVVGSAAAYSRRLTVPGAELPVAGVSWVAVRSTHRRRGVLTAMMRKQLDEMHERGTESVAILWASEPAIYGRFGYGQAATGCRLEVDSALSRIRREVPRPGRLRNVSTEEVERDALVAVYEAVRRARVGWLDRSTGWWDARLADPEHWRHGAAALRCLVHEDDAGTVDGYVLYAPKQGWEPTGPHGELLIRELVTDDPGAYASMWGYLLDHDLVRVVRHRLAAVDEPLVHLVDNMRAVQRPVGDTLWVRLVDLPAALAARTYLMPVDVVLEVTDDWCPWNTGRYRLSGDRTGATCVPSTDAADLSLPVSALGAAYLGGTTLAVLGAAGVVCEIRPAALTDTSAAFSGVRPPHCPEIF